MVSISSTKKPSQDRIFERRSTAREILLNLANKVGRPTVRHPIDDGIEMDRDARVIAANAALEALWRRGYM